MKKFKTGAIRNSSQEKLDYEAFLSPIVLERFARHMHLHAKQEDGNYRPGDNWQLGLPQEVYMKSLLRHTISLWKEHRGFKVNKIENGRKVDKEDLCCAIMFNVMGFLFEEIKKGGEKNAKSKRVVLSKGKRSPRRVEKMG
jgi:hypothetical protein